MAEQIIKYNVPKGGNSLTTSYGNYQISITPSEGGGEVIPTIKQYWNESTGFNSLVPNTSSNIASGDSSVAIGQDTRTTNNGELALGQYNLSVSGETLFTIGNGSSDANRSNLIQIGNANTVVNNNLNGTTAYFNTSVKSPTVSGSTATFNNGTFYTGITSPSATFTSVTATNGSVTNISGDTALFDTSVKSPTLSGDSVIASNISGTNATFTSLTSNSVTSTAITSSTVNVSNKITTNQIEAVSGYIQTLLSDTITVDNLTVTKAAHFFKLLIDEIKATQGQIILTPCNATIDKVETVNGNYRCYFRAKDDDKEISNNFEVNDQVVCQTFNAASGVSYNASNTYYWRLCVATGTTSTTLNGETVDCHYIDLSNTDKDSDSISAPTAGDNVVQLGNRTSSSRQSAIIISAYNTQFLDKNITAPSIVQYYGINDYNLANHRRNVISRDFNEFKGDFKTSNGNDIEELIDAVSGTVSSHTQSISQLQQTSSSLTSTVSSHTNSIDGLSGQVSANSASIAQIEQTSSSITATVSALTDGDTNNLFYPSCYNSEGMSEPTNQWLATNILSGETMSSAWTCANLTKYGKPIINGAVTLSCTDDGEVYLYSPYLSLNKTYYYSLTFSGYSFNHCYVELCRYTSKARAISATTDITSVQQIALLGDTETQYFYNQDIINFKPNSTSSYYRIRFRLIKETSFSQLLNLSQFSLYRGTSTAGISAGSFAPWSDSVAKTYSQITQKANEIDISLESCGINLKDSKITSIGDKFEWQNNDGETVLGIDNNGNATFTGTIKASNFYHNLCIWSPSSSYYNSRWCYMSPNDPTDPYFSGFTQYHYYTKQQIQEMTDYHYGEPPEDFVECTYDADIVYMTSLNWTGCEDYCVNLPRPEDYEGKLVEVIARTYGLGTYTTKVSCVNEKMAIGVLYINDGELTMSGTLQSTVTISVPSRARFLSVHVNNNYYWFYLSETA